MENKKIGQTNFLSGTLFYIFVQLPKYVEGGDIVSAIEEAARNTGVYLEKKLVGLKIKFADKENSVLFTRTNLEPYFAGEKYNLVLQIGNQAAVTDVLTSDSYNKLVFMFSKQPEDDTRRALLYFIKEFWSAIVDIERDREIR